MPTTLDDLAQHRYDLLVVGADIHGVYAAFEAASRGLAVALIDRDDIASDLTSTPPRTIHGGLQALGRGRLTKAGRLNAERRTWARLAPHYVRPLPFLIGTYRWTRRSRWLLRAGFAAHDVLTRHRNADVAPELHLPKARLESAAATRRLFPGIAPAGLSGGAIWYDYHVPHAERVTWSVALAAERAGARLATHIDVVSPIANAGRIAGVRLRDAITGVEHDVETSSVLLAGGAALTEIGPRFGVTPAARLVGVTCVVIDRPARDIALVARAASGRPLVMVPWRGRTIVHALHVNGDSGRSADVVGALLDEARTAFPALNAQVPDVRVVQRGLAPAERRAGPPAPLVMPAIERHARDGSRGVVSLAGASFAFARVGAVAAVRAVSAELSRPLAGARSRIETLPHAGIADTEGRLVETARDLDLEIDPEVAGHLVSWYGTEAPDVVRFSAGRGLLDRVSPGSPVILGEIAYAAAVAGARRLTDVVLRRTPLGATGHPGGAAVARAASLLGAELGWTDARRSEEAARLDATYPAGAGAPTAPQTPETPTSRRP